MLQEGYMLRVQGIGQQQHVVRAKLNELAGKEQTDAFYKAWLANNTRKIDIDSLKAWGFNAVRLPMHYNLYTLPIEEEPTPGQQTWLEQGFVIEKGRHGERMWRRRRSGAPRGTPRLRCISLLFPGGRCVWRARPARRAVSEG